MLIDPSLSFEGFDATSWTRLLSVFSTSIRDRMGAVPMRSDDPEADDAGGGDRTGTLTLIVTPSGTLLKAHHSVHGRVRSVAFEPGAPLETLAAAHGARRVIVLEEAFLEEVFEQLASRVRRKDDYLAQWLTVAHIIREALDGGRLRIWPRPLANVPIPPIGAIEAAVDLILPPNRSAAVVLWEGPDVWTALVLRRGPRAIEQVLGPDSLRRLTGPLGGDWRRDHRFVAGRIHDQIAPLQLGVFTEARTLKNLLRTTNAGAWARSVAVRDVVVHPSPKWIHAAVGADLTRAAFNRALGALGEVHLFGAFVPMADGLRHRWGRWLAMAEHFGIRGALGFDPLDVLGQQLRGEDVSGPTEDGSPGTPDS